MSDFITEVVVSETAQRIAGDISDNSRYYRAALADVQQATEKAIENASKGYRVDASWVTHYANKAAEYQTTVEKFVEIARYVGLTKAQVELAASGARVWFQTEEEAAK